MSKQTDFATIRRVMLLAVAVMLALFTVGCSSEKDGTASSKANSIPTVETRTVYVMTQRTTLLNEYHYDDFKFDESGNLVQAVETRKDNKNYSNTITYEYAPDNSLRTRVENVQYKALYDDYVLTTTYDEHGQVEEIVSTIDEPNKGYNVDNVDMLPPASFNNSYNNAGQLVKRTYKTIEETYEYDSNGQLSSRHVSSPTGSRTDMTYSYDENGNCIREDVYVDDDSWTNVNVFEPRTVEVKS